MDVWQLLLELIGVAACGKAPTEALREACTPEALEAVYALGAKHDLAHLVGQGAGKLQLPDSAPWQSCKKAAMDALLRYTRQEYAFQGACGILEQGQIPFIPLKGAVLRQWYPEPWMRTGCDIDILVREADREKARALLEEQGWKYGWRSSHDISLLSPQGVHLELHHCLLEDYISQKSSRVLEGVWDAAKPLPGKRYQLAMPDALFYFYHLAHMAKHVLEGGCGIRSFLDIWVLNHRMEFDRETRQILLSQGGLTAFGAACEALAEAWFAGGPMDELCRNLQDFVLRGGTYGSLENQVSLQNAKKSSKFRFLLERIFLPYGVMKYAYPALQKRKWLTPVFWVVRWFRLLFGGKLTRSVRELKTATELNPEIQAQVKALLTDLEL